MKVASHVPPTDLAINQPTDRQLTNRKPTANQPGTTNQPADQPANQPANEPTANQPVNQPTNQPTNQQLTNQ